MAEPIASNDLYTVTAGNVDVLAQFKKVWVFTFDQTILKNDSDADGDSLSVVDVDGQTVLDGESVTVTGSEGGLFTISSSGEVTFDGSEGFEYLAEGESVQTVVTYTVSDGNGGTSTAQIIVTVEGVDGDEVFAENDLLTTTQDDVVASLPGEELLANDSTSVGDSLTVSAVDGSAGNLGTSVQGDNGGLFTIDASGNVSFDPNGDFTFLGEGETLITSVIYEVTSTNGSSTTATASVEVTGVNDAPELEGESYTSFVDPADGSSYAGPILAGYEGYLEVVMQVGAFEFDRGLLSNDTDIDKAPSEIFIEGRETGNASNGSLTITEANGVELVDGEAVVAGSNGGSFAIGDRGELYFNTGSDFDDLYIDQSRVTTIEYTVSDEYGATATATASVTVYGSKPYIVALSDSFSIDEDSALVSATGDVLANDSSDVPGALVVEGVYRREPYEYYSPITKKMETGHIYDYYATGSSVEGQNGGIFSVQADGTLSFDPNGEFDSLAVGETATTSIYYQVEDVAGNINLAQIVVTIDGVNDGPVATDDSYQVDAGTVTEIAGIKVINGFTYDKKVVHNDTDTDGDVLSVELVNGEAAVGGSWSVTGDNGGLFTILEDGTVTFDASTGDFDSLEVDTQVVTSFEYTVSDGNGGTDTALVSVTVNGLDEAPSEPEIPQTEVSLSFIDGIDNSQGVINRDDVLDSASTSFISHVDLRGAQFALFGFEYGPTMVSADGYLNRDSHQTQYETNFAFDVSDTLGNSVTSTAIVNFETQGYLFSEYVQPYNIVQLNEGEVFVLDVNDFVSSDTASDFSVDASYGTGGVDFSQLLAAGFGVNDIGNGQYELTTPDTEIGNFSLGEVTVGLIDSNGLQVTKYVEVGAHGTSLELMTGSSLDLAQDDVWTINENNISSSSVFDLFANDASGLELVSIERGGDSKMFDAFAGVQEEGGALSSDPNNGLITLLQSQQFDGGLDEGEIVTEQFEYTVVDEFGNYDTATLTVNIVGENSGIEFNAIPSPIEYNPSLPDPSLSTLTAGVGINIYENMSVTFDDSMLLGNYRDLDVDGPNGWGVGLSSANIDGSNLVGSFISNADGSFTYDPNGAFDYLGDQQLANAGSINYDVVSDDGSVESVIMFINVWGVDDPVV